MNPRTPSSTPLSSSVNLINNIIGAGLFSMPWCLEQSTVLTGILIFFLISLLNVFSFMLLAKCCTMAGCYSYLEIGEHALGPKFGIAAQLTAMLYACGSLVSYVVLANNFLLGDGTGLLVLASHTESATLLTRIGVGFAFSAIGFLPLSLLRRLDSLKLSSWAALLATLYAGFITVYQLCASPAGSLTPAEEHVGRATLRASVVYYGLPLSMWSAVPIVNVAFTAHYNAPRYFEELEERSVERYVLVTGASLLVALIVYLAVGVCGYLSFGEMTSGDVLENFKGTYSLAVGARAALLIVLVSCYPKVQHSVRDGIIRLGTRGQYTTDTVSMRTLAMVTIGVVGATTLIGTLVQKVEVVLAYKGGIFGSLLVYVWPATMYMALAEQRRRRPPAAPRGEADGGSGDGNASVAVPTATRQLNASLLEGAEAGGTGERSAADGAAAPTKPAVVSIGSVLLAMLKGRYACPTLLLVWGVTSGCLGVGVTVYKQLHAH